ncbi:unnamed protein product [Adineta ricciae]|uniref:Peptidase M61 N-terminal domain-containing protein n=1 Tax=Adineta ricciae TaxID=249248 RepID=A0A814W8B7_ADIRI|nr:unnamed protein product [Adineta ricciae]CAF1360150.1 unnamed protein product [Adineta ricciae]
MSFLVVSIVIFATSSFSTSIDSTTVYAVYTVSYNTTRSTIVHIDIQFMPHKKTEFNLTGRQTFIMPRSVPSGYNLEFYDFYVDNLTAVSLNGGFIPIKKESISGPRWSVECLPNETLSTISYSIDLTKHEQGILSAGDASKIRLDRYIGILGYSVFGYLEQMDQKEHFPIMLNVRSPSNWPIHLTLSPTSQLPYGQAYGLAKNYYHLADSQIYMGPNMSFHSLSILYDKEEHAHKILPFYVVAYTEDSYNLNVSMVADLSVSAMQNILIYYESMPFLFYTVAIEMIMPLDEQHSYGFSIEHLNSCTINVQYGSGVNRNSTQEIIKIFQYNLAHHIQHAWIPKRLFSKFYYPFTFELTPVIDTIWFNEGFGQYIAMDAMASVLPLNESYEYRQYFIRNRFEHYFNATPLFIKHMSLEYVSMIASSLYSTDFRTGTNVFSRGALLAKEIDEFIQSKTQKRKSLRDGIIYLMQWSEVHQYITPFSMKQFPLFFLNATNVDVTPILNKWL